jgi:hypothetical protein
MYATAACTWSDSVLVADTTVTTVATTATGHCVHLYTLCIAVLLLHYSVHLYTHYIVMLLP